MGMDSLVSCSIVISNVCASKVTGPEPSLWECSGIHHICPAEPDCGKIFAFVDFVVKFTLPFLFLDHFHVFVHYLLFPRKL